MIERRDGPTKTHNRLLELCRNTIIVCTIEFLQKKTFLKDCSENGFPDISTSNATPNATTTSMNSGQETQWTPVCENHTKTGHTMDLEQLKSIDQESVSEEEQNTHIWQQRPLWNKNKGVIISTQIGYHTSKLVGYHT